MYVNCIKVIFKGKNLQQLFTVKLSSSKLGEQEKALFNLKDLMYLLPGIRQPGPMRREAHPDNFFSGKISKNYFTVKLSLSKLGEEIILFNVSEFTFYGPGSTGSP